METLEQQFKQELKKTEESVAKMIQLAEERYYFGEGVECKILEKMSQMIDSLKSISNNTNWDSSAGSCGWLNEGETTPAWDSSVC